MNKKRENGKKRTPTRTTKQQNPDASKQQATISKLRKDVVVKDKECRNITRELHVADEALKQEIETRSKAERDLKRHRDHLWQLAQDRAAELELVRKKIQSDEAVHKQAETVIRESKQEHKILFESLSEGLIRADLKGNILDMNRVALRMFGYRKKSEIQGKSAFKLIAEQDKEKVRKIREKTLKGESSRSIELTLRKRDGTEFPGQFSIALLKDKEKKPTGFVAIVSDISKRKKSEETIEESEAMYRNLVEMAPDAIIALDLKGKIVTFNSAATDITGYSADEVIGKHFTKIGLVRAKDMPRYLKIFNALLRGKPVSSLEMESSKRDGESLWLEVQAQLLRKDGKSESIQVIAKDITDRKKAEDEIIGLTEFYEGILENIISGVWVTDSSNIIYYANSGMGNIDDVKTEKIEGKNILKDFPEETIEFFRPYYIKARNQLKPLFYDSIPVTTFTGRKTFQSGWLVPKVRDRKFDGMICTVSDVTQQKEVIREVRNREKEYRVLLESLQEGIWAIDKDAKMRFVNPHMAEMLGYRIDEMMGRQALSFLDKEGIKKAEYYLERRKQGIRETYEARLLHKNGKIVHALITATPLFNEKGQHDGSIAGVIDITEKKKAEERISWLASFPQLNTNPIIEITLKGDITYINPAAQEKFPDLSEQGEKHLLVSGIPEMVGKLKKMKDKSLLREVSVDHIIYEEQINYVKDRDVIRVYTVDVTKKKEAEKEVRESEKKYRSLFANIMSGFALHKIVLDERGKPIDYIFLEVNDVFEQMTGLKRRDILGKTVTEVLPGIEKDSADWIGRYGKVALTGVGITFEQYAEPLKQWYSVAAYSPRKGYFAAVFNDITKRKEVEEKVFWLASFPELNTNPIVEITPKGDITYVNPAAEARFPDIKKKKLKHPIIMGLPEMVGKLKRMKDRSLSREVSVDHTVYEEQINYVKERSVIRVHAIDVTEKRESQQMLIESEEKYRSLFEGMLNGFAYCKIILDKDGRPIDWIYLEINDAFERLTGLERKNIVGKRATLALPEIAESHPELFRIYGDVAMSGKGTEFEIFFKPLKMWLVIAVHSPQKGYFVSVCNNITERKQDEERYQSLVENVPGMVYRGISDLTVVMMSPKVEEITGYTMEEFKKGNTSWLDIVHPDDKELLINRAQLLNEKETSIHSEYRIIRKDNSIVWLSDTVRSFHIDGKMDHLDGVVVDITKSKNIERILSESEKRFKTVFEGASDGILAVDVDTKKFGFANESFCKLLGHSQAEIAKMSVPDIHKKKDLPRIKKALNKQISGEEPLAENMPVLCKDKKIIYCDISSRVVNIDNRDYLVGFFRDVTFRKQAEEQLKKTKDDLQIQTWGLQRTNQAIRLLQAEFEENLKQLEMSNLELKETQAQLVQAAKMTAIGDLGASIAHELNQPLGGIRGYTEVILKEIDKDNPMREDLQRIEEQTERISKITSNMRMFAHRATFEMRSTDIHEPLKNALTLITAQLRSHDIELTVDLHDNLPKVDADPNQLQQVFLNLFTNARDALDSSKKKDKHLVISSRVLPESIELLVVDDGCGMSKEDLKKAFTPFFTTKPAHQGTGLGLSVSYSIIENHYGLIEMSSRRGKGTIVRIVLPAIGSDPCWVITDCPRNVYSKCPAYTNRRYYNCWTVAGTYCREKAKKQKSMIGEVCEDCQVYQKKMIPPLLSPSEIDKIMAKVEETETTEKNYTW